MSEVAAGFELKLRTKDACVPAYCTLVRAPTSRQRLHGAHDELPRRLEIPHEARDGSRVAGRAATVRLQDRPQLSLVCSTLWLPGRRSRRRGRLLMLLPLLLRLMRVPLRPGHLRVRLLNRRMRRRASSDAAGLLQAARWPPTGAATARSVT